MLASYRECLEGGNPGKVPLDQIESRSPVVSTMPPMLALLNKHEIRDVVAWLATLKAE